MLPSFIDHRRNPKLQRLIRAKVEMVRSYNPEVEIQALCKKFGIQGETNDASTSKTESTDPSLVSTSEHFMQLYEVKRRFRSVADNACIAKNGNEVKSVVAETDDTNDDESSAFATEEGHHLPIDESEGQPSSKSSSTCIKRRNVIFEEAFVSAASEPNEEMGNGGFFSKRLAKLTFRAGCRAMQRHGDFRAMLLGLAKYTTFGRVLKRHWEENNVDKEEGEANCWTLYDALFFGCHAVRGEALFGNRQSDADMGLLQFLFTLFSLLPKSTDEIAIDIPEIVSTDHDEMSRSMDDMVLGENRVPAIQVISRSQVGHMIILILEQAAFRLRADSPISSAVGGSPLDYDDDGNLTNKMVSISEASLLGLLPPNFDSHKIYKSNNTAEFQVPLDVLIDHVFEEAGVENDHSGSAQSLSFQQLLRWFYKPAHHSTSLQLSQRRLGPLLMDMRVFASVVFGIKPFNPSMEKILVKEIMRRHRCRYPESDLAKRGPIGTVWFVVETAWWNRWLSYLERHLDDFNGRVILPKIDNTLLVDSGTLVLKPNVRWKVDFEV